MQGVILTQEDFYQDCIIYNVNLPYHFGNINIIPTVINKNNKVNINSTIYFNGDLINDYNDIDGLITYLKIEEIEFVNNKYINFSENYFSKECMFYKVNKPLSKTLRGVNIFKFSIKYTNIFKNYTVLNCIAFGKTAVLMSQFNASDYIYIQGKLISRNFLYKEKYQRQILELHVKNCELLI